ncbi:conjugal transfer protein TraI [Aeromonas hydrophila NJ-35]|uniref:MobH family relaxase n=1 Tax=Aeromonas TaxID=642 RepID=UPI000654F59B|nr:MULTISPECIES: MobH family relaxase [Aeromonas]AKJ36863.1 conjugal transfer protein TraI [Aeromonas hydrophila NJ-35]QGW99109.1 conjugal transfer protein TraI [Aeromonas veronii]HDK8695632.1 TraI domain-containing protein [Aeromonas hydrophila]
MLNVLNKLFGWGGSKGELHQSGRILPLKDMDEEDIPRYPPFAKGLPVAPIDKILATQAELIEKVRNSLGFTVEDFNRLVLPVIRRYAAFVHLLPASEAHHHRGAGGLFRHGLEVAFWAAQASESVIFSIEGTPKERRDNEPRWRLASCFSGLLHDVGKPLADVSITDKNGAVTWNPYFESLHDWAERHHVDRYFIRWREKRHKRHEQFSLLAVDRIIPVETREYLSESGPLIIEAMLEAISGTSVNQPVTRLMLRADQESVARDLKQNRLNVDEFSYGVPVERYVFDAIRRLVKTGKWKVNEPGAKVWHLQQGVFIAWRNLGDLYDLISHDKIPGIPRDPDTLADILIERGFAVPNTVQEKGDRAYYRYWEVLPEMLQEATGSIKILMLRLESNELVFTTEPPAAVAGEVVGDVGDAAIELIDPDETNDADDDSASGMSDNLLSAEQEAMNALAGLGFGDAMTLLGGGEDTATETVQASPTVSSTPQAKGAGGHREKKQGKKNTSQEPEKQQPELSPQEIAKSTPPLAEDNPLQAIMDVGGGLGGLDFPFDVFVAGTSMSDESGHTPAPNLGESSTKPDNTDAPKLGLMNQIFPDFMNDESTGEMDGMAVPPSWAIEEIPPFQAYEDQVGQPLSEEQSSVAALEKDAKGELVALMATFGEAGPILEKAILPVLEGKATLGEVLCLMKGQAVILYPEGARALGAPSEILTTLFQAQAIVPDPIMSGRKVQDFNGIKAIVLTEQLSNAVIAAIKQAESLLGGYQDTFELVASPEVKKEVKKNQPKKKRSPRKPSTAEISGVDSPAASPERVLVQEQPGIADALVVGVPIEPSPQLEQPIETAIEAAPQPDKVVPRKEKVDEPVQTAPAVKPATVGTQNIARLPQREKSKPEQQQKPAREFDVRSMALPAPDLLEDQNHKGVGTAKAEVDEELYLPPKMTAEKAIQMLKEMIKNRSGRWLVSAVLEEEGFLVTSDKAFEVIAGEYAVLSKHVLGGTLRRAQSRPLLKQRQGKLYLEVDKS